jgi:hypothetical protein
MYQKCYVSRNLPTFDSKLISTVGFYPVNFYYLNDTTNATNSDNLLDNFKMIVSQFQSKNLEKCFITFGNPSDDDYIKINKLKVTKTDVGSEKN